MPKTDLQHRVDEWQAAYHEFFNGLDAIPFGLRQQPGACGEWNVRQVVAHLSGWHAIALAEFELFERGDVPPTTFDDDAVNAENVAARAHLDWTQTLAELRVRLAALADYLDGLIKRGGSDDPRFGQWLQGLGNDARDHMNEIAAWVAAMD